MVKEIILEMRSKWQEGIGHVNNWETVFQRKWQVQRPWGRNKCRMFEDMKASVAVGSELKLVT